MAVWRVLLNLSITLLPTNGVVGIDASGFDRSHASKHYMKRTKLTIQQLKVTDLVDTRSNAIIDVHVTTTRKHDSKIAPSLTKRNTSSTEILLGERGMTTRRFVRWLVRRVFVLSLSTVNFRRSTRRGTLGWTPTSTGNVVRTRR
jgi:IS5 family transposase